MAPSIPFRNQRDGSVPVNNDSSSSRPSGSISWRTSNDNDPLILIKYDRGDWEQDGPIISRSRLVRFSKRAARELRPDSTTWVVKCQHYMQAPLLDKIFAWFKQLPNRGPRRGFVERDEHPVIDQENRWVPQLSWQDLLLLDHSIDYLHLREPLDNKKIRRLIWNSLSLPELENNVFTATDLHLAFNLLQIKPKWLAEALLFEQHSRPLTHEVVDESTPSSLSVALDQLLPDWDHDNRALLKKMVRQLAFWFENEDMYFAYARDLWDEGQEHDEDNVLLMQALEKAWTFREHMRRPGRDRNQ